MAFDATTLETMRDALLRARATGTRSVTYSDGRRVEYKTDAEMSDAIADLDRRIANLAKPRPSNIRFTGSKGF